MMKKLLSLFLALVIALSAVGICYATAEADDKNIEIPGEEVPGSPTVDTAVYEEETIFIDEEPIPEGTPETSVKQWMSVKRQFPGTVLFRLQAAYLLKSPMQRADCS